jgi:hypothetical protein
VAVGGASGRWLRGPNAKCTARAKCEGRKETTQFSNPAYIRRLNDEYRRAVPVSAIPHIFVGGATSPMNIVHVYSSVTWYHRQIYMAGQSQTDGSYIRR